MPDQETHSAIVPEIPGYGEFVEIGSGGFSHVYRARQFEFERPVAIKVLDNPLKDDAAVEAFEQECRTMGALWDHPNIVPVYASAFTTDGRPCIVMKLFHEGSYFQVLKRNGPIPLEELLIAGVKISGALAAAHEAGVIHGDVKPHNIFKSKFGEPALGDFGIATFVGQHGTSAPRGLSVHYAAPDLVEGEPGPKADQYSLAATIFTLAVGRRPFESPDDSGSNTNTEVLLRVLEAATPQLPETFPELLRITIRRAMDRDPDLRYDNLSDLGKALSEVEHSLKLPRSPLHADPSQDKVHSARLSGVDRTPRAEDQASLGAARDESTTGKQSGREAVSPSSRRLQRLRRRNATGLANLKRTSADNSGDGDDGEAIGESAQDSSDSPISDQLERSASAMSSPKAGTYKARVCGRCKHAHPPAARECHNCGKAFNNRNSTVTSLPQLTLGRARLPQGTFEVLDANLVLGRNPSALPLNTRQRPVTIGGDDRTVSRQQIELRPNGWRLQAHILGRNSRLEKQGRISELDPGAVVNMSLGDTLHFGSDSWVQYVSVAQSPPASPSGAPPIDDANTVAIDLSQLRTIKLSNGTHEVLDADLIIGRNPAHQPLEPNQRAVMHGEDDRTISRRHVELRISDSQLMAICLGHAMSLERDGTVFEISTGESERLKPGDILYYGKDSRLQYEINN